MSLFDQLNQTEGPIRTNRKNDCLNIGLQYWGRSILVIHLLVLSSGCHRLNSFFPLATTMREGNLVQEKSDAQGLTSPQESKNALPLTPKNWALPGNREMWPHWLKATNYSARCNFASTWGSKNHDASSNRDFFFLKQVFWHLRLVHIFRLFSTNRRAQKWAHITRKRDALVQVLDFVGNKYFKAHHEMMEVNSDVMVKHILSAYLNTTIILSLDCNRYFHTYQQLSHNMKMNK